MKIFLCETHVVSGVHFVTSKHTFGYTDINVMLKTVGMFLVGGMLSFMLEISEFLLLSHTSGLTLTIAGVFRVRVDPFILKV